MPDDGNHCLIVGENVSNARERREIRDMAISAFHEYSESLKSRGETEKTTNPDTWPKHIHVEFRQVITLVEVMRVLGMTVYLFGGTETDIEGMHNMYCGRCRKK